MASLPDPLVVQPGLAEPLGATVRDGGVNFAVLVGPEAERIELCLFEAGSDGTGTPISAQVDLPARSAAVAHGFVEGLTVGTRYGFRVHGPWEPGKGLRYNPAKLLVDPWSRAIGGALTWDDALLGHVPQGDDGDDGDPVRCDRDSAPFVPRSLVVDSQGMAADAPPAPATPWRDTVIYEAHVGLLTARHPDVPPELRGTYAGLASEAVTDHLRALGVTAIELLPVHHRISERALVERGLTNAWGYNTLGFFAPDPRFASDRSGMSGSQVGEFRAMVDALHRAGIEVILDVVYNHTCEGDQRGPTLSWRGLDPLGWYHHGDDPHYLADHTGCGNTLRGLEDPTRRLLFESLRYWARDMGVDGFRFDLAPAFARRTPGAEPELELFEALREDDALSGVKLIAEPWDATGGYMLGGFPSGWAEWNGKFRDDVRRFWRGDEGIAAQLATRLAGSTDLFTDSPLRSVNFVTCHDGATLHDLTTYEDKHNEDNGEDNNDGSDHEHPCHWGVEGETDDAEIVALRGRTVRAMMATLRLAAGVPMLTMGDELARTQHGNNNAYCQEGERFAVDWPSADEGLPAQRLAFARRLAGLARELGTLRADVPFDADALRWLAEDGTALDDAAWQAGDRRVFGMHLTAGDELLLWFHAGSEPLDCRLPHQGPWELLLDSAEPDSAAGPLPPGAVSVSVQDRSLVVLRLGCEDGRP